MNLTQRAATLLAVVVLLLSGAVYLMTLTPTVPFWDSGEFIAVSYILGVPHPPGTPLFVLIGRLVTLVPWATVAQRVNALSAMAAALAVMLTFSSILRMTRAAFGRERAAWQEWAAYAGAFTGALMLAFSDNYWENSIEAEVYQMMSLGSILVFWLGLKWWESHEKKPNLNYLVMATYVLWLSVGVHLGVGVMGAPLLVLVAMLDWRAAVLFALPFLSMLRVVAGLEKLAGAVLLLSFATFTVYMFQKKLPGWIVGLSAIGCAVGSYFAFSDANFTFPTGTVAAIAVVGPMVYLARRHREGRILLLLLFLMVAGYSTHLFLPIRAALHPAINEGAPATWDKLRDLLERKQYGEMNMFVRRASWSAQLNKEFWRYFQRQWPLFPGTGPWTALIPLVLGLAGAWWQGTRDFRRGFLLNGTFFLLNTAGLIVFLNFTDHEVRDRDYFFQSGYHAYAMWIGMGVTWLIGWVRESFGEGSVRRWATTGAAALLCLQPFLLMHRLWFTHDRSHNYIARDYAFNMLAPLKPNSFMFTNGDNDTFPLWYIQQVEGVRKDVRIVNLSLLNTDWYIRQLRDEAPRVPISLDDKTVDMLGLGAIQDEKGHIIYTNEFMVRHIMDQARKGAGGWVKQPYFAVTVPEHYGFDPYFSLQGLVYEVKRDSNQAGFDAAATEHSLYHLFLYRGLFTRDMAWDSTVYKDDNASLLSHNYASAHLQLAWWYRKHGQLDKALAEMQTVQRMFPDLTEVEFFLAPLYMEMGDTDRALAVYAKLAHDDPRNPEALYYYGASLAFRGRTAEAMRQFEAAMQLDPGYQLPYFGAYTTLWEAGERERAVQYLQRWLEQHPDDPQANAMLTEARRALGMPGVVPPPGVQLPGARP